MIDYIFSILADKRTKELVRENIYELNSIFENQNIPVSWVSEDNLKISLLYLGNNLNIFTQKVLLFKLRDFKVPQFNVSFGTPKIGISDRYHELIFLPINEGADLLRNIVLELGKKTGLNREHVFIPHMTIGRVSKDLSKQEYRNLKHDFYNQVFKEGDKSMPVKSVDFSIYKDNQRKTITSF